MTVAQYGTTNFTSQTGTAYKTQLDANSVAAQRIVGRFAPHAQSSPNMTVALDAGSIFNGVTLTEVAAQNTGTFTAPVSHPRIDRIVIDNTTGTLSVVAGAESTSPVPPAIPNGKSPVAQVLLQTSTTSITNAILVDERNFSSLSVGGFGAQATIGSAASCDLGTVLSRNAKITGTTSITSFGSSANTQNPIYLIEFAGALTLTNGTGLLLPGSANITTAAGDSGVAEYLGSGNWRVRDYQRADGTPLNSVVTSVNGHAGAVSLTASDVGLGSVQNVDQTNASNLTSGTVPTAQLGSGTASSSTFLRGDGAWATPAGASGYGTVGTYVTATYSGTGTVSPGSTTSGSNIGFSGTWRNHGTSVISGNSTLWLRIS